MEAKILTLILNQYPNHEVQIAFKNGAEDCMRDIKGVFAIDDKLLIGPELLLVGSVKLDIPQLADTGFAIADDDCAITKTVRAGIFGSNTPITNDDVENIVIAIKEDMCNW